MLAHSYTIRVSGASAPPSKGADQKRACGPIVPPTGSTAKGQPWLVCCAAREAAVRSATMAAMGVSIDEELMLAAYQAPANTAVRGAAAG